MLIAALSFFDMGMGLFGGLALFLFGMELMTSALKSVAGDGMKRVLSRLTHNRFKAVFAGAFVTAIIQSSSVTTVLVVGFVSAGLMTLQQSIGMIMGAGVGTTVTAQIVAFKVTKYALLAVAGGFVLQFFSKKETVQQIGWLTFGLGLIFFGMFLMGEAMKPLRSYEPFIELMRSMDNPLLAILISAVFTALVQSSSATTAVVIMLAKSGFISLDAGIALILGANIGTCATAMLASIGKTREAVQTAMVHLTFNVAGVLLWIGLIHQLAAFVTSISPTHPGISDPAERLAADTPRQIANAHTTFNVANTFIFIWFTKPLASFVRWLVPVGPEVEPERIRPKFLDENLLLAPSLAFNGVSLELARTGEKVLEMIERAPAVVISGSSAELDEVEQMDDDVDQLHGAIVTYLGRLSGAEITEKQTELLHDQFAIANYLENMADVVETNFVTIGRERIEHDVTIGEETLAYLRPLVHGVTETVRRTILAISMGDPELAQEVIMAKSGIAALADEAYRHLVTRVGAPEPHRVSAYRIETEMVEAMKRLYYLTKRVAKVVAEVDMAYLQEPTDAVS